MKSKENQGTFGQEKGKSALLIVEYDYTYSDELLRLLLELHLVFYNANADARITELSEEVDIKKSYQSYVDRINMSSESAWKVLLAKGPGNVISGFIIGSILIDNHLVKGTIGNIEDWFVTEDNRGQGVGTALYMALEQWFLEKKCQQVMSMTWAGNVSSLSAHQKMGFFTSAVSLSKKLG